MVIYCCLIIFFVVFRILSLKDYLKRKINCITLKEGSMGTSIYYIHSYQTGFSIFSDLSKMLFFLTFHIFFKYFSDLTNKNFLTFSNHFSITLLFSRQFNIAVLSVFLLSWTIFVLFHKLVHIQCSQFFPKNREFWRVLICQLSFAPGIFV